MGTLVVDFTLVKFVLQLPSVPFVIDPVFKFLLWYSPLQKFPISCKSRTWSRTQVFIIVTATADRLGPLKQDKKKKNFLSLPSSPSFFLRPGASVEESTSVEFV